jgi:hypothetical protein
VARSVLVRNSRSAPRITAVRHRRGRTVSTCPIAMTRQRKRPSLGGLGIQRRGLAFCEWSRAPIPSSMDAYGCSWTPSRHTRCARVANSSTGAGLWCLRSRTEHAELPISSVGTASVVRVLRDPALQPVEHPATALGPALGVD